MQSLFVQHAGGSLYSRPWVGRVYCRLRLGMATDNLRDLLITLGPWLSLRVELRVVARERRVASNRVRPPISKIAESAPNAVSVGPKDRTLLRRHNTSPTLPVDRRPR